MSRGYLLDTNIAIAILVHENTVIDFIQQASRDKMPMYFSVITNSCGRKSCVPPKDVLK
ncbi:hypothetical protein AB4Z22_41705 [Paenibacillus sp. TAF58]